MEYYGRSYYYKHLKKGLYDENFALGKHLNLISVLSAVFVLLLLLNKHVMNMVIPYSFRGCVVFLNVYL